MKEAYYFSHDSNASQDEKILNLRADHGWAGYGLYWAVIERLRDANDFKYKIDSLKGLAVSLGTQLMIMQQIVTSYGLFENDGEYFWSESLTRRMKMAEEKRESFRQKGMKSGAVRSGKKSIDDLDIIEPSSNPTRTQVEPSSNPTRTQVEPNTNNEILKGNIERKLKESKKLEEEEEEEVRAIFLKNNFEISEAELKVFLSLNSGAAADFEKRSLESRVILFADSPKRKKINGQQQNFKINGNSNSGKQKITYAEAFKKW